MRINEFVNQKIEQPQQTPTITAPRIAAVVTAAKAWSMVKRISKPQPLDSYLFRLPITPFAAYFLASSYYFDAAAFSLTSNLFVSFSALIRSFLADEQSFLLNKILFVFSSLTMSLKLGLSLKPHALYKRAMYACGLGFYKSTWEKMKTMFSLLRFLNKHSI